MTFAETLNPTAGIVPVRPFKAPRIESIDLLRGVVMVIMALDHVRDYFHKAAYLFDPTDLSHTTPAIFLTRWITHFCAPIFMLLAGVSAQLYGQKKGRAALSRFLWTRGLWLIFVELFVVTLEWTFNPSYSEFILQVIWAFGLSMIALSALVYLPTGAILLVGAVLVAGHNTLDNIHGGFYWDLLHDQRFLPHVAVGYPIIPWIGIISMGYALGTWYRPGYDGARRRRNLLYTGLGAVALFVLVRSLNVYGDPNPWSVQKSPLFTCLSFINVTKYPPSLLYALLTLGPALIFLSLTERPLGSFGQKILVFGRVPMFYYLVHIALVHFLALIGAMVCGYPPADMTMINTWVTAYAPLHGYGFNLLTVYVIWIGIVVALYPVCRWYDQYKRSHQQWWLSYL